MFSKISALNCSAILLQRSDDSQNYKIVAHLNLKGAPAIKKATLLGKKSSFERENVKKMGFLRVFTHYCTKSLCNFTVLLWWCSNLQHSRLFDRARCASNEMDNFIGRKKVLGQETSKKWVFWGFHTLLYWIASQFYCSAPMMLKLTGWSPIWFSKVRQ